MLKRLVNEAHFILTLTTTGPLLVRSGHATLLGPDMTPVLTFRDGEWQVYLPGSSLKGVLRSHLEKVARTLKPGSVCNPFWMLKDKAHAEKAQLLCPEYAEVSCGDKFERRSKPDFSVGGHNWQHPEETISTETAYRDSCPICRLFGSTEFIGRVSINDAYLVNGDRPRPTEVRDGVGIDRLSGGASHGAKFDLEAVSSGVAFTTAIHLRNFETWQLGMLLLAVQDLEDELIRVGSGRSRGLGSVKGSVEEVKVNYLGAVNGKPAGEVWGLGKFLGDGSYGTQPTDALTVAPAPVEIRKGIRLQATFGGASLTALREQTTTALVTRLQNWAVPDKMRNLTALGFH